MSKFSWYWHRLRAMTPLELALHARKKLRQFSDARRRRDWRSVNFETSGAFPKLPKPADAPEVLRDALKRDVENILAGRWKAFSHLELQVDDPPKWHCDYLVGKDFTTAESAFRLNHRELPDGADIKLIWELSRWNQLVRLAMAAYVLGEVRAGEKCLCWLEDWVKHNPPFVGWNWTSALEAGLRLVQFAWIDALLAGRVPPERLSALREAILPAHAWYAWRHRSFGSSANNHLLGELAGLIVATVRWPALEKWGTSLSNLHGRWEREVLAQFAEDGGNKEQALNYHLFSWEFCWQARAALLARGRRIYPVVEQRLGLAAEFFGVVQVEKDSWDYGDSDNGFVTPFFAEETSATSEWWRWMRGLEGDAAVGFWCGEPLIWEKRAIEMKRPSQPSVLRRSGIFVARSNLWTVRWDASPLGYLKTAAHGHLDALHVSIWYKGVAIIVDPGTGAYFADPELRDWLASRAAHNGPCLAVDGFPKRLGPFLWSQHHPVPKLVGDPEDSLIFASLRVGEYEIRRSLIQWEDESGWQVQDECVASNGRHADFSVRWQFAPGSWVKRVSERVFTVHRGEAAVTIGMDDNWSSVELIEPVAGDVPGRSRRTVKGTMEGIVSPSFRMVSHAPFLKLTGRTQPCVYRTSFGAALAKPAAFPDPGEPQG